MTMQLANTATTATWMLPVAPRRHDSIKEALRLVKNVFHGRGHDALLSVATVSAIAISAELLVRVLLADYDVVLDAGDYLTNYLRDWDIMSGLSQTLHGVTNHPVWAIYRQFVDHTVAAAPDPDDTEYTDVPGYTADTIVTGIGYAVANLVQLRLGSTEETVDEFLGTYGSLL